MTTKFPRLTSLENALHERFGKRGVDISDVPFWWLDFPLVWMYYTDRDELGISPRWYETNNLYRIKAALYCYYRTIVDDISKKLELSEDSKRFIGVYIEPDETNECAVLVVQRWLNHLVYLKEFKVRYEYFRNFEIIEGMESVLQEEFDAIIAGVN